MTPIALMAALTAPALASPSAFLEIDNDFEGELELYVDGRYHGLVPGDERLRVDVKKGRRDVRLQRPGTHARVLDQTLHFSPGVTSVLEVRTPMTTLQVRNTSPVPLQVDLGPGDGVWIAPSTSVDFRVPAGTVSLEARVRSAGRVEQVRVRTLWAEPGLTTKHVLDYTPPAPTRITLKNRDHQPLRAVVDGVEVGWLDPGENQGVTVSPGMVTVRFYDAYGRLVSVTNARATKGDKTPVVATATVWKPAPPPRHVRPASSCSGSSSDRYARR